MAIELTPFPPSDSAPVYGLDEEAMKISKQLRLSRPVAGWFRNLYNVLKPGVTKQVVIGGTTLTFVNGIFTGSSP